MKRFLKNVGLGFLLFATAYSCNLDYFNPTTFAVPIANLKLTVGDILKRFDNNIVLTDEGSRSFLTLIFTDTLEPIELDQFAQVGVVPQGTPIPIANEKVDLKLFGTFDNGSFQLTNPRVDFTIINTTKSSFELEFIDGNGGEFYTEKKDGTNKRALEISSNAAHPYPIPMETTYKFSLDNSNVIYVDDPSGTLGGAMTQVMEPTPKFLNYSVNLTTTNTNTLSQTGGNGSVQVLAGVFLPLEGFGDISYLDTANYEFIDTGQVDDLEYMEIRLIMNNGIPLECGLVQAVIIDTNTTPWTRMLELPLLNSDDSKSDGIVVPAATQDANWKTTAIEKLTDIVLTKDELVQPTNNNNTNIAVGPEISQIEAVAKGNKLIIEVAIKTTGRDEQTSVKMYNDQFLKIRMGIKAQAGLELGEYIPKIN
jgi:hypothetical protein